MKDVMKVLVYAGLFAVPLLTLYVENDFFFPFITGKNFGFRIIVDILFAAWIILALYDVKYRPKISGIVWSFGAFLVVMFFANLFGLHPESSFWSNFERMDGYVSLVHTFMYMLVLGSVLQGKAQWQKFLNTSLVVAFMVAFYGLAQYSGMVDGGNRIDSRLGNAAYMAIYMLFHIFIAFWLFIETKNTNLKVLYGVLVAMFAFVLLETGTRGTAIGLVVGVLVMSGYIGLFGTQFRQYRKYAIGAVALLAIAIGGFVIGKDSAVVQSNPNLARIANISLDDLQIRGIIWGMAWEGVQERPLLGYGQSNFNYVFNENYDPRLYGQEQWFDRAHNIFMDWLIAGGFLGLIAYLSIFAWCAYYLFFRPLFNKEDNSFDVVERGVLLGILAGYFTHNFVVFDNIVSYIFFAVILALINSRVGVVPKKLTKLKVDKELITQVALPVVTVVLVAGIYFFHIPGIQAAGDIIDAFRNRNNIEVQIGAFERAVSRDSFAHQEITEQISQQAISLSRQEDVPEELRQRYLQLAEEQIDRLLAEKPGDARVHVFAGSYYRATNQLDKAAEQMALAREHSPNKQAIIIQQAFVALSQGNPEESRDFMQTAFELDENNLEAREYYAGLLLYTDDAERALELMEAEGARDRFARSDFLVSTASQFGHLDFATELFETRVNTEPDTRQTWRETPQTWATLAYLYYQRDNNERAIEVLEESIAVVPSFASSATCFIDSIEADEDPQVACQ